MANSAILNGFYTFATLPPANSVTPGTDLVTKDGAIYVSNGTSWLLNSAPATPYVGVVATNCKNMADGSAQAQWMSRSLHKAAVPIPQVKLLFQNWVNSVNGETNPSSSVTITASVEYPAATFNQVKFAGSTSGVATAGNSLISDWLTLSTPIPAGATFYVRHYRVYTGGATNCPFSQYGQTTGGAGGDSCAYGASVSDQTMSGTISNTTGGINVPPTAILGPTSATSYMFIGDSRLVGGGSNPLGEATASNPCVGELAPAFYNAGVAFINSATGGDKIVNWTNAKYPNAATLAQYVTSVISQHSINDTLAGTTGAQLVANQQTVRAQYFSSKKYYLCTIAPNSSSTDSWATTINQSTSAASEARRVAYNRLVRAGVQGVDGYYDIAAYVEAGTDTGFWVVNGTASFATGDGLHENPGATGILSAAIVPII